MSCNADSEHLASITQEPAFVILQAVGHAQKYMKSAGTAVSEVDVPLKNREENQAPDLCRFKSHDPRLEVEKL